jgi:hypothetical protein
VRWNHFPVNSFSCSFVFAVAKLEQMEFLDSEHSVSLLLEGLNREEIDFSNIFKMAAELFTHLGVACTYGLVNQVPWS